MTSNQVGKGILVVVEEPFRPNVDCTGRQNARRHHLYSSFLCGLCDEIQLYIASGHNPLFDSEPDSIEHMVAVGFHDHLNAMGRNF